MSFRFPYHACGTGWEADSIQKGIYHRKLMIVVHIGTSPYYRLFNFNTLRPIKLIALCTQRAFEPNRLLSLIDLWKRRKRAELQFVSLSVSQYCSQTLEQR